jgi:pectin methylesterase-like acyl-CoA thioesterase
MLAPLLVAGAVTAQAGVASAAATGQDGHHKILYVSRHAWPWGADRSCHSARFRTIQSAVNAVRPGGTVVVCPGTYHEQVVISSRCRWRAGGRPSTKPASPRHSR